MSGITEEEIKRIIEEVRLNDLTDKMPKGLDTQLGEHFNKVNAFDKSNSKSMFPPRLIENFSAFPFGKYKKKFEESHISIMA